MITWDYADLSSMAKASGGPERLLRDYYNSGRVYQRNEDLLVCGIALAITAVSKALYDAFAARLDHLEIPQEDIETVRLALTEEQQSQYENDLKKAKEERERILSSYRGKEPDNE